MAAPASRVYAVNLTRIAVTTAATLLQVKAGATVPLQILRSVIAQTSSTTSTQQPVQINRKTGAATVTAYTALLQGPVTDPAASAVGGTSATGVTSASPGAEGTDGDIIYQDVFNYLNGWTYLPSYKEWPYVSATGIIATKLPVAPGASVTITGTMVFEELG